MDNFENRENFENTDMQQNIEPSAENTVAAEEGENAPKTENGGGGWKKEAMDWIQSIVIALVVAFLLKNFVLTLAKVQGQSMEPTLQNEDRMYVNRLMYTPKKGDVIIFRPASDPKRPYIKRVIATEGDTVYIDFESGDVYVNDELLDEPYIYEPTHLIGAYIESVMEHGEYSRENPIVVEKDKIFVMGDNRNHSKDSREIGQIPVKEVIGHAVYRFWPLNNLGNVDYER